jgi:hypothetical protein
VCPCVATCVLQHTTFGVVFTVAAPSLSAKILPVKTTDRGRKK